jgi:uncharacterized UPF0160 family protein
MYEFSTRLNCRFYLYISHVYGFISTMFHIYRWSNTCLANVSQRVQMNFIFNENVRILCLSCNVKKVGKLVRFKQKGEKQASFLAFHKCCQWCLLRGPRYISTNCLRPPLYIATGYQESLSAG